jgi:hypothetical protein
MRPMVSSIFLMSFRSRSRLRRLQGHVGFLARAVVGVREYGRLVLHRVHGAVDVLRQIALHLFQHLAEVGELPRVHVFLFPLGLVGGDGFV